MLRRNFTYVCSSVWLWMRIQMRMRMWNANRKIGFKNRPIAVAVQIAAASYCGSEHGAECSHRCYCCENLIERSTRITFSHQLWTAAAICTATAIGGFEKFVANDWVKWLFERFSFLFVYFYFISCISAAWNRQPQICPYACEWMCDVNSTSCLMPFPILYTKKDSGQTFDDSHHPLKFDIPTITNSCLSKKNRDFAFVNVLCACSFSHFLDLGLTWPTLLVSSRHPTSMGSIKCTILYI